jgi:alkylated DNA repair protein (DNA oxidative demethylase)
VPDAALVNFYDGDARLGMHQDKDERSDAPVVSLSGDACVFRFGNTESRGRPYTDVELRSGDLFVFGGPSRFAYHRVPKLLPGTADHAPRRLPSAGCALSPRSSASRTGCATSGPRARA